MTRVVNFKQENGPPGEGICPHCNFSVLFQHINQDTVINGELFFGQRRCPRKNCQGHIFAIIAGDTIVTAYPPIRIDFSSEKVPTSIRETFEEALDCEANGCRRAAGMMIRRTLEEICVNKSAKGNDLATRLQNLKSIVVLPPELFRAMNELRLLGNDAVHIEAKTYDDIGDKELSAAIALTKEIIKAIYQYDALTDLKNSNADSE